MYLRKSRLTLLPNIIVLNTTKQQIEAFRNQNYRKFIINQIYSSCINANNHKLHDYNRC